MSTKDLFKAGVDAVNAPLSQITAEREKIELDKVISKTGGEVTLDCIDVVDITDDKSGELKSVVILVARELPNNWFYGGTSMYQITLKWIETFESVEGINSALAQDEIKLKFVKVRTKSGRPFTTVNFVR